MKAIKENRQYTITKADVGSFQKEGYDIYDDDGHLYAYGVGKTVSFEKYMDVVAQLEAKDKELLALRKEVEKLKGEKKEKKGSK